MLGGITGPSYFVFKLKRMLGLRGVEKEECELEGENASGAGGHLGNNTSLEPDASLMLKSPITKEEMAVCGHVDRRNILYSESWELGWK